MWYKEFFPHFVPKQINRGEMRMWFTMGCIKRGSNCADTKHPANHLPLHPFPHSHHLSFRPPSSPAPLFLSSFLFPCSVELELFPFPTMCLTTATVMSQTSMVISREGGREKKTESEGWKGWEEERAIKWAIMNYLPFCQCDAMQWLAVISAWISFRREADLAAILSGKECVWEVNIHTDTQTHMQTDWSTHTHTLFSKLQLDKFHVQTQPHIQQIQ